MQVICFCFVLVCAVLKTLHSEEGVLTEEECCRVGEGAQEDWWDIELAVAVATKPLDVVRRTLAILEVGHEWVPTCVKG